MKRQGLLSALAGLMAIIATYISCSKQERIVISNVNVITMTSEAVLENRDVIVEGGRITAIVEGGKSSQDSGDRVINGTGRYLIPGLADMHVHFYAFQDGAELPLYLANGVTTVRDCNGRDFILAMRDEVNRGTRTGPRIFCATQTIRGYEDEPWKLVGQRYARGYDFVKFYSYFQPRESFHKAMGEAKRLGAYTMGHIPYTVGLDGVITEGMDEIAHIEEICWEFAGFEKDQDLSPDEWLPHIVMGFKAKYGGMAFDEIKTSIAEEAKIYAGKLAGTDIIVNTTCHYAPNIKRKIFETAEFARTPYLQYLPADYYINLGLGLEKHQRQFRGIEDFIDVWATMLSTMLVELHREGVIIAGGTDAIWDMGLVPGFSLHDELDYFVEIGFTPYEALTMCTANAGEAARRMEGLDEPDFGTIEAGRRADLVLLDDNPLVDISNTRKIAGVMADGRWYPQGELAEMLEFDPALHKAQLAIFEGCYALRDNDWSTLDDFMQKTDCEEGRTWVYGNRRAVEKFAAALHRDGRYDKVKEYFDAAVTANWDDVNFLNAVSWNVGVELQVEEVYPDAIRASLRAIELNRHPAIFDTLALLYALSGEFDKALEAIDEAKALAPDKKSYDGTREKILEMKKG